MYDYLIVGAGLFGSTFANLAKKDGKKVLVIEKRNHLGGNIYTENMEGINVHKYGAHIFHTDYDDVWEYVNSFTKFNRFVNSPVAIYKDEVYNLPFNMNTFVRMWDDCITPSDALMHIEEERKEIKGIPKNLEQQAISLVGRTIYEKLIKEYTEKQWNRECIDLPTFIIKRLPVRFTYNNDYFNDKYEGIPTGGYTNIIKKMLEGIDVLLETDYFDNRDYYKEIAKTIIYTGAIDEYFNYSLGKLEYRSLNFDTQVLDISNFQGNAVINYTSKDVKYTRIIEHKHFENVDTKRTVITYEYPTDYTEGLEKYYPINDDKNNALAEKYRELAKKEENVIFGGRLAEYKYYDMDDVIKRAMDVYGNLGERS